MFYLLLALALPLGSDMYPGVRNLFGRPWYVPVWLQHGRYQSPAKGNENILQFTAYCRY